MAKAWIEKRAKICPDIFFFGREEPAALVASKTIGVRTAILVVSPAGIPLVWKPERRNTREFPSWHLPSGAVMIGENAQAAAVRRAKEEIGVDLALAPMREITRFVEMEIEVVYAAWVPQGVKFKHSTPEGGEVEVFSPEKIISLIPRRHGMISLVTLLKIYPKTFFH